MAITYIAAHPADAEWMVGETVPVCKHAFRTSGYDLKGITEYAAGQRLKVLKIDADGIIRPVWSK